MQIIARIIITYILVLPFMAVYAQAIPADSLYLGNTPPEITPKIFNFQLTSGFKACERIAITSDGKEIYYGEINTYPASVLRVKCYKYENNRWNGPFITFDGFMAPKLADNDSTIYLQDNHFYTYCSKRVATGWSVPVRVLSADIRTHYFQKSGLNNFFASSYYEGSTSTGDICKIVTISGDTVLQSLGFPINTAASENDFLMAIDESYLIFSRNSSNGSSDMFISFRKENSKWTNPKKFGDPINKPGYNWEYGQFMTSDGKYLFYTSGGTSWSSYNTYWVRIDGYIDSLRNTNFVPYLSCQIPDQSTLTGHSYIYTVPDSTFIDDDGINTLTWSASLDNGNPLPVGLSFDPSTRTFSGIPLEATNMNVKVTVTDSANVSVSCRFILNVAVTNVEEETGQVPAKIKLFQNYPNPFNPSTTIKVAIPKAGWYKLNLYNVAGEDVKEISYRYYEAGYHEEIFNANGLSSGIYFYRLTGYEFSLVCKMVLLQ